MSIVKLPGLPLIGNLLQMRDMVDFLQQVGITQGRFVQTKMGPYTTYFLWDRQAAQEILQNRTGLFTKGPTLKRFARPILGNGIITADDENARKQRDVVGNGFSPNFDDQYIKTFIDLTQKTSLEWKKQGEIKLENELTRLSLDLLGQTLLATDFSKFDGKIMAATEDMYKYIVGCIKNPFVTNINLPFGRFKKARVSLAFFHKVLDEILSNMQSGEKAVFLHDVAMLSIEDYRDMVLNIFFAGHETSSSCLFWTLSLLLNHPTIYQELKAEICSVSEEDLSPFIKQSNSFLAKVILESMRLYPPVHTVGRELTVPSEICGESFHSGDLFAVSLYLMGRNPGVYARPTRFEPHRFDDDTLRKEMIPYSVGPRACLGKHFADIEIRSVLTTLLRSMDFKALGKWQPELKFNVTLRPQTDLTVKIV